MKKTILVLASLLCGSALSAAPLALVYENEEAVMNGKSIIGTVVDSGIAVAADSLTSTKISPLVGAVGEPLRYGSLMRMDTQLNLAIIQWGDVVPGNLLQQAHQRRSEAVKNFLPAPSSPSSPAVPMTVSSEAKFIELKINDQVIGSDPVVLKKRLKKSKFKLDIVFLSTVPVWNMEVNLESDPALAFWKEGKKMGLNDVPQKKFRYSQQIMFRALGEGRSLRLPIEVYFIEQDEYVWTFHVFTPKNQFEQKVKIKFE